MRAHSILPATWHFPSADSLRHSMLLGALFAVALVALTALAMSRLVAALPTAADFSAWAAEPYQWYAMNVLPR